MKTKIGNVGILIICRLNSQRLKNKILKKIYNKTLIQILLERLSKKINSKNIIICTSSKNKNKFFKQIYEKYKIQTFYGDDRNLFSRIINCSNKFKFKNIVRITGDNPLTDINAMIKSIKFHCENKIDYTYTTSLMIGTRPEVFNLKSLKKCKNLAVDQNSSEYLTYFFLRKYLFKIYNLRFKQLIKNENNISVTIDYKKDLNNLKKILKNNSIYIERSEIIKTIKKNNFNMEKKIKNLIPVNTTKYNVKLKNDNKDFKYINLKNFGY